MKSCKIEEQTIDDAIASGLKLRFTARASGGLRLHIEGSHIPQGNRDFFFTPNGLFSGSGTRMNNKEDK